MDNRDMYEDTFGASTTTGAVQHLDDSILNTFIKCLPVKEGLWYGDFRGILIVTLIIYAYQVGLAFNQDQSDRPTMRKLLKAVFYIPMTLYHVIVFASVALYYYFRFSSFSINNSAQHRRNFNRSNQTTTSATEATGQVIPLEQVLVTEPITIQNNITE